MSTESAPNAVAVVAGGGRKGRRKGVTVYAENPFREETALTTKTGTRRLSNRDGTRYMVISQDGEVVAPAGFHEIVEVDRTSFVKLYVEGASAFAGLSPAGNKVFAVLYRAIQNERPGSDRLWVHFKDVDQRVSPMSIATFKRGMRELLDARFIAESDRQGMYWLNSVMLFNGDRLAFVKEYRLKGPRGARAKQEALEAAGQQRLLPDDTQ